MNITTKSGDRGVSYWRDKAVGKDSALIEAIGTLDELQAVIEMVQIDLEEVKTDLWGIMGEISWGKTYEKLEERIADMEKVVDDAEYNMPKLEKFVVFKSEKGTKLNWVRTIVRGAERRLVELSKIQRVNPKILAYINRLSDYLFILARREE